MMEDGSPAFLLVCNWIYLGHKQMQMTGKTKYWPWSEGVVEVWSVGPQQRVGVVSVQGSRWWMEPHAAAGAYIALLP